MEKITLTNLGPNIKEERMKRGMSQKELAIKAGIYAAHLCHFEKSNVIPSLRKLVAIMNALEVSFEELVK